jgi:hypothetical protein
MLNSIQTFRSYFDNFPGFLSSAAANFLGSLLAAAVVWWLITRFYELPRTRGEKKELLAVSYALIKRELEAASQYCSEFLASRDDQLEIALPITQGWETLHSTEAFKFLPPTITEKLVAIYSLLFRLRKDIELTHMLIFGESFPMTGENPYRRLRQGTTKLAKGVASEVQVVQTQINALLQKEFDSFGAREKEIFAQAYRTSVGTDRPKSTGR